MNIILFDNELRDNFLPLVYTKPVCDLRVGILTIREKWEIWMNAKVSFITQDYLAEKYPINLRKDNLLINSTVLPSEYLFTLIDQLELNEALLKSGELIAARLDNEQFENLLNDRELEDLTAKDLQETPCIKLNNVYDIFKFNAEALADDFDLLTKGRKSAPISQTNTIIGDASEIFLEEGATVECAVLNVTEGPIYIGKGAEVMEGALLRGGVALCDNAQIKMGAKIYGATTLGPYCKVGGEVNNAVFTAYSSKAHDGYLGNAVIGEWCNIGADSNNSNLKNNYAEVKLWNYSSGKFEPTGLQFCGLIMGDHAKCGINTMFNTGTVVGVSSNLFGAGFPRNFVPSFAWGGHAGYTTYMTDKAFETIERVMARRNMTFDTTDRLILLRVFEETAKFRNWEKTSK